MGAEALPKKTKEDQQPPTGDGRYAIIIIMNIDFNFCLAVIVKTTNALPTCLRPIFHYFIDNCKTWQLRMHCNLRLPARATAALSRFNYDAMPSLKSLNISIAVL